MRRCRGISSNNNKLKPSWVLSVYNLRAMRPIWPSNGVQFHRYRIMTYEEFLSKMPEGLRETHKQMRSAINAGHRFARAGFAPTPPEALAAREAICRACPEWDAAALNNTGRCRKCGCSTWAKLRMATERCPLGKWEAVDKTDK